MCHRPNHLQEAHHALWVGGVGVVSGGACLHVGWTAQEQVLCYLSRDLVAADAKIF